MDTNPFWIRGSYAERKANLAAADREWLEATILDSVYNEFLRGQADYRDGESDPHGHGKRLPYIGWYWRHLEFSSGGLPLGNCGFVGFMANNKWDYPERTTTPEEFAAIMALIDAAMVENGRGGILADIVKAVNAKLDELWDYLQTLKVT